MTTVVPHHRYFTLRPELTSCLIPVTRCRRDVVSLFFEDEAEVYGGKEWIRMTGVATNTDEAYNVPVLKLRIQPSWDARFCMSRGFAPTIKQWLTQVETQDFASHKQPCHKRMVNNMPIIMIFLASHKQPCRKPTLNNIPHISMLLSLWRRKILRLYKARAINIKYYWPYWCATACHIPTFLHHSRSALFGYPPKPFLVCISFYFLHISDDNQIVTPFFPRQVYSL